MDKHKKNNHHDESKQAQAASGEQKSDAPVNGKAAEVKDAIDAAPDEACTAAADLKKEDELKKLTEELDTLKDLMQRRQADFENYKKRQMKIQQEQKKLAIKDFALDIIEINDDLLRAIEVSGAMEKGESLEASHRSFVDGVNMISRRIEDALAKYGIVEIDSLNLPFDPNFNEAVEIEMSADYPVDTVTKVHQKGFRIDDIVLRSARVKVAKAGKPQETTSVEGSGLEDEQVPEQKNAAG